MESWKVLNTVDTMDKLVKTKNEFKQLVGKHGVIILTPDIRNY